ncbi:MAG: hypothetical protein ACTSRP_07475 [Candidatus Helarchaeota archaeon]
MNEIQISNDGFKEFEYKGKIIHIPSRGYYVLIEKSLIKYGILKPGIPYRIIFKKIDDQEDQESNKEG